VTSIASFQVQLVFCAILGSRDISKTKWGIRYAEYEILYYFSAGKKKRHARKGYFWSQKYVFYVVFFFSSLKMIFCKLILSELGHLLGLSLLRNFFSAARSIFSCKYFSNISNSSNFIPHFVLLISRLPDIAQKTACTRNEALDVTFQMKYVLVF